MANNIKEDTFFERDDKIDPKYWAELCALDPADVKTAKNYVTAALADMKAGRPVAAARTRPYGCTVKYAY